MAAGSIKVVKKGARESFRITERTFSIRVRSTHYWLAVLLAGRVRDSKVSDDAAWESPRSQRALQAGRLTNSECFARVVSWEL